MAAMTPAQNKLYQKGYRAGRKSGAADALAASDRARFDRFLAAAMTGLLARENAWGHKLIDGSFKKDHDAASYTQTAANIAREMMRKSP